MGTPFLSTVGILVVTTAAAQHQRAPVPLRSALNGLDRNPERADLFADECKEQVERKIYKKKAS
jgi:hypothetical protein